jgi:hypothetical protein
MRALGARRESGRSGPKAVSVKGATSIALVLLDFLSPDRRLFCGAAEARYQHMAIINLSK